MSSNRISRRRVMQGGMMAAALAGGATLFGPWKHTRAWAQGAARPIKLGLTCDATLPKVLDPLRKHFGEGWGVTAASLANS